MSDDVKRDVPAVPPASQIAASAANGAKAAADPAAKPPATGVTADPAKAVPPPPPPPLPGKPVLGAAAEPPKVPPLPPAPGKPVLGAAAEPPKVPPLPPAPGKPVLGAVAEPPKVSSPAAPVLGKADIKTVIEPAKPVLPPPPVTADKPAAAHSGRGLAWLALVVGLLGLAAGVVAVAGPRLLLLADRQFPQAAWIEPAGRVLNPGWSITAAEFDRRVNLLEGVLAKAEPGAVSREDVVELLLGRFEGKRGTEVRDAVEGLKREAAELGRGLQAERQASEARSAALAGRIDGVDPKLAAVGTRIDGVEPRLAEIEMALKGRLEAIETGLPAAKASVEELRGQVAALAPLAERTGKIESQATSLGQRLDETVSGLDELKRRAAGPERLLVAVLQLQISSQTGRAFAGELRLVRQIIGADPALARAIEVLTVPAQRGAPTVADLRDQFGQASSILVERGVRESRTWFERVGANVKGTLAGVGLTLPPPLTPVEASVAETQRQLANGNLLAALTELETLDPSVRALAGGWVAQAQLRLAVDQAVSDITNATLERASKVP